VINDQYPFVPVISAGRRYSHYDRVRTFMRDGFIDRYKGTKLVFPGTLRLLSLRLPDQLPFHPNWKMDRCHQMWWDLCPTIDHVSPVSHGGRDAEDNWVTTSMRTNAVKANWTLEELEWELRAEGLLAEWDGQTQWFVDQLQDNPALRDEASLRPWAAALGRVRSDEQ
jgi:hypothetical protein